MKSLLRSVAIGLATALLLTAGDHLWWNAHPGSKAVFLARVCWWSIGALLALFVIGLIRFYVREYKPVWWKSSEEETYGVQR